MLIALIVSLFVLIIVGIPVGFALMASTLISIFVDGNLSISAVPQRLVDGLNSTSLLSIPLFILAGSLMNSGGITTRLIRLSESLVGHIRGSLAHVSILTNMFMAGISGSGVADAAATGTILAPEMQKRGYGKAFPGAVIGAAATIGSIIPPSIPMIVYGSIANVSIGMLFVGGIIPGVLMGLGLMLTSYFIAKKRNFEKQHRASMNEVINSFKESIWAIIMPIIIVGGILTGIFTYTEAACIAVLYSIVVGILVYKELKITHIPKIVLETTTMTAIVGIIISAASPFGWIMAYEQGPLKILEWIQTLSTTPWIILLILVIAILILGCFLEGIAIIIITTPVILPIISQINVDPIHFGIVLTVAVMIGTVTPPVGVVLYVMSSITKSSIVELSRELIPFFAVLIFLLLIFAYVPEVVMFLPKLLM